MLRNFFAELMNYSALPIDYKNLNKPVTYVLLEEQLA